MSKAAAVALPPREYEAVYILRPDLNKETSERVADRVAEVIAREGGTLTLVENWGRRPMSYEIQHYKRGVYVYINYLGDGALVAELERNFRPVGSSRAPRPPIGTSGSSEHSRRRGRAAPRPSGRTPRSPASGSGASCGGSSAASASGP
jgi:ribosomal protein S6